MSLWFVFLMMLFAHKVDDYNLQGILASMKVSKYWTDREDYSSKYMYDYIMSLVMHSISWAFMIQLPLAIYYSFDVGIVFTILFFVNTAIHAYVDDLKANKYKISLVTDQMIHIGQIIITFIVIVLWNV